MLAGSGESLILTVICTQTRFCSGLVFVLLQHNYNMVLFDVSFKLKFLCSTGEHHSLPVNVRTTVAYLLEIVIPF